MKILGIDPGYAIVGYGVVNFENSRYKTLEYGAITTPAEMDFNRRLKIVYDSVYSIIQKNKPEALSIEKLYFHTNQKTAIGVAEARGVILLAAVNSAVEIFEYTPLQVKTTVTGYGRAQKQQVMEMTRRLLGLKEVPKPDDTADALAIAICHGQAAGTQLRKNIMLKTARNVKKI